MHSPTFAPSPLTTRPAVASTMPAVPLPDHTLHLTPLYNSALIYLAIHQPTLYSRTCPTIHAIATLSKAPETAHLHLLFQTWLAYAVQGYVYNFVWDDHGYAAVELVSALNSIAAALKSVMKKGQKSDILQPGQVGRPYLRMRKRYMECWKAPFDAYMAAKRAEKMGSEARMWAGAVAERAEKGWSGESKGWRRWRMRTGC